MYAHVYTTGLVPWHHMQIDMIYTRIAFTKAQAIFKMYVITN